MKSVIKAGKLANGAELGKGSVIHLVKSEHPYFEKSLCNTQPTIQWIEINQKPTCLRCLNKLNKEKS